MVDRSDATQGLTVFLLGPGFTTAIDTARLTGVEDVSLTTGTGADRLVGGAGDDALAAGAGADALAGGDGADSLDGGAGADTLLGGAGADLLVGGAGADAFVLQDAAAEAPGSRLATMDRIQDFDATAGDRLWLAGQSAAGAILPLGGVAVPTGFAGSLAPATAPLVGMVLPDATGGSAVNIFWLPQGGQDAGWLLLDRDRDGVLGAADLVTRIEFAQAGATLDAAAFAPGSLAQLGTAGDDTLVGGATAETIDGFAGADLILAGIASDSLDGGAAADTLLGGVGFDSLAGGEGADSLDGGADADVLSGGAGDDRLDGGAGADRLDGDEGADWLDGGTGDDTLLAGAGADSLTGGEGADVFVLPDSGFAATPVILDFAPQLGDRLRLASAQPLVWSGQRDAVAALTLGLRLPAQQLPGLEAVQVFAVPDATGPGAWLVLDLDGDGLLGADDPVTRIEGVAGLTPADFAEGSFLRFATGSAPAGTPGDDSLAGTALAEGFAGTDGSDSIDGGAGAPDAISYGDLGGPVAYAGGTVSKSGNGQDLLRHIRGVTGTVFADTLDGDAAPLDSLYALSFEGLGGDDLILGHGNRLVQASYAGSLGAVAIDLAAGTAADGWGGTDTLVDMRRVAVTSPFDDTVLGSAADEIVLSGGTGSKWLAGGGGWDEYRYAGAGSVYVMLAEEIVGLARVAPHATKPGGTDTLLGFSVAVGNAGDDTLRGGGADERFAGGAGSDSIEGGAGSDTVFYDLLSSGAGLAQQGVVLDLGAGTATDPWGGQDSLAGIEDAWGTQLADDLTGIAMPGSVTTLRGLAGDDTLRAPVPGTLVAADYATDPRGIQADLGAGWVWDGWGGRDRLVAVTALRGSDSADSVAGSAWGDWLAGGGAADTLDGGPGADTLLGGAGSDLYRVDNAADLVAEDDPAAGGADTVEASASFTLPDGIEELVLLATGGVVSGTGNSLANRITGNAFNNWVRAGNGADTLTGNGGNDVLFAEAGDDLLLGGDGNDHPWGGDGNDTILAGDGIDIAAGDAGEDSLLGEAANDQLDGGLGDDTLDGGADADRLIGGFGNDSLLGGTGVDRIGGSDGNDTIEGGEQSDIVWAGPGDDLVYGGIGPFIDVLSGGDGNDTLIGSAPPGSPPERGTYDRLLGGAGDDVYWVDVPADMIFEVRDSGYDVVHADIALNASGYTLAPSVEALVLHGRTSFGIGNLLNNRITGSTGDNLLRGNAGRDTLEGGGGVDMLSGEEGIDLFVMRHGPGQVTITDFDPLREKIQLLGFGFADVAMLMATPQRQLGADLVFDFAWDEILILQNLTVASLSAANFLFG